ncbi:MAG TPA: TerB family tellurite resistance protein [Desulfobacterales bacterium]|nr:TerB family tellurite resistance protein [Desulfobacterales bacterium]
MLDVVKRFFSKVTEDESKTIEDQRRHDTRVAACALFVEMASIDETFTQAEMDTILSILKEKYGLSREHADALIAEADKARDESVDLWQFARRINENYSNEEKIEIIETLWRIVYVDGKMDKYEHYLMNKLATLLRLSHEQLIDAKLKVLDSSKSI